MMQLNSKCSQSKICVYIWIKKQIELHLFWGQVLLKKWNSKYCDLIQSFLSLNWVHVHLNKKPNWVTSFLGWTFLREMKFPEIECNWIQSGLSLIYVCVCVDLNKKPNWVASFLKSIVLKEMKFKIVQLNSKWSQSNKMCVCVYMWNKKVKLSCTFFGLKFS